MTDKASIWKEWDPFPDSDQAQLWACLKGKWGTHAFDMGG